MTATNAILLIAHGSRRAEANADLNHLAEQIRQRGRYAIVETAYLELAEPDIETGGVRCVERGASQVTLLPYFLSPGVHVREDLIEARETLSKRFPEVAFRVAEPLGRHPLLIDIVEQRAQECEAVEPAHS
ncbi:sirohydrochlorin chelatase [Tuwongella immobilis]|uniref:Cobalamin biosynthesis protein CbiX n=1 Tax=Tuwongella immobilis TaxID=692036 RepID=A0A6C2YHV4_9BACT|nr:CbiX/SirB N-terminal domain-containing protein [Tuwongella immobilis]VIP01110.1 cobalamin (vitamin b12) biosynthesis protein : Cobalamin (Vitamin B12) biosynthesis CbiX protein OS=Planctomyces maris DSM 8797 GN=PM8797T_06782 PE=4 SV=1: CbiX [Tuwongella immobilis]VTR97645.1 cobalamin (vitamin b12) biosynthesis protein : Cobalamin (Vitamin B12) biosynthesis CbiX protein OS=Planctomyces maris DSM 8797 GN=PM8797T_06782 PE=4 SV=1: CbiX [Tuwongella immobilis]